jgi:hypothetical protein
MVLPFIVLLFSSLLFGSESEMMRSMKLGCEKQKMAVGCYHYANLLIKNGNESLANKYFEKGCKLGNSSACSKERWKVAPIVKTETTMKSPGVELKVAVTTTEKGLNIDNQVRERYKDLLLKCEKSENKFNHPIIPNFVIVETIHGLVDGKCKYTQTMPNNGLMSCLFDETERKSFAQDPNFLSELMGKACEISGY